MFPVPNLDELITVRSKQPGGPHFTELKAPGEAPVLLGSYANSAVAQGEARALKKFVAAVLREESAGRT
jgi:hypothetical protein